jgi:pimeloyl-ACP methyl ester carboxylesterase
LLLIAAQHLCKDKAMTAQSFTEHRIPVANGSLYARDHAGNAPAFVLMHGFPDNLHIYDDLIPHLVAAGRRVVAFDFLGFGASDKPRTGYSFAQQMGDLEAVITALNLDRFVPVVHDSSGLTGINYALTHPDRVASLAILNSAYDDAFPVLWPELVELFATQALSPLAMAFAESPEQFGWLLLWQQKQFRDTLPEPLHARFDSVVGPLIADNFLKAGSGVAFAHLAAQFHEELARNSLRLPRLASLDVPVKVIWGEFDPYITTEIGKDRASHFRNATFRVLPAGHWLQSDLPEALARELLA